jgi:purine-binding chemotaxis protein CheW
MSASRQFCTFYVNQQFYGIDVLQVQEIVRSQPLTRVPLAAPMVRGLMNLRGQIVTAIDMRRRLALPERDEQCELVNVVLQTGDGAVALLVDEIGDVVEVDEQQFERPPDTLRGPSRDLILGAYKRPGQLLVILDPQQVVSNPVSEPLKTC